MAHAEQTITINRPVSVVYNFVLDGENSPKWRSSVKDIQRVPGKPSGVGAVYKQGLNGPGGRPLEGDYEIVEAEPRTGQHGRPVRESDRRAPGGAGPQDVRLSGSVYQWADVQRPLRRLYVRAPFAGRPEHLQAD